MADYVSDLIADAGEKDSFLNLVSSITENGYVPSDPIVVWKDSTNNKYYVAEGNRRTLALKLLRNPEKSPKSIRSFIKKNSALINRNDIEKIKVCVAPSFEECEWYINQRHATSSLQRPWSRLQQQRWIAELYDKYNNDIDKITSISQLNKSQLEYTLRILKIRDFALDSVVLDKLNADEQEKVKSHRVPMTILERWFTNPSVKEAWGLEFDEDNVNITSNKLSFLNAYTVFIRYVIHRDEPGVDLKINTRTINNNGVAELLEKLPKVSFEKNDTFKNTEQFIHTCSNNSFAKTSNTQSEEAPPKQEDEKTIKLPSNKNPDRNQLVINECQLETTNHKLAALFGEFKHLPITKYKNCLAASLRVFLDLAITEFIYAEGCISAMETVYSRKFYEIPLKSKLEYLKQHKLTAKTPSYKVAEKLLNHTNEYSLDTLNNYIHGNDTHHTDKRSINGFWDFLYPLFEKILDIKVNQ